MKTFKLAIFSLAMVLFVLTSCTNNESVIEEPQNTHESESITTALFQLRTQFDDDGNVTQSDNPAGNIVLDFCFDFVYPLNLSYNNGTTVTVENLNDIINVMLTSTEELYINGIAFPFNVETLNNAANNIEVVTINNEVDFVALLESCGFDDVEECICTQEANPVCVEISDPNGTSFTVTYPNSCYAECDGFTEDDFIENCGDDYNCPGGNGCFEFNFPFSIVTDNNETVTINSQEELDNAVYDNYYFDFVYPLNLTLIDGVIITINNQDDFEAVLEDCFGDVSCPCPTDFNPVCVEIELANGETEIITFGNACEAECQGFTAADFIDCDGNPNPSDCSEEAIALLLQECTWLINTSLYDTFEAVFFSFDVNYVYNVNPQTQETTQLGSWVLSTNPSTESVILEFNTSEPYSEISSYQWTVAECGEDSIVLESGNEYLTFDSQCSNISSCIEEVSELLTTCSWSIGNLQYVFNNDGTLTINDGVSSYTGIWLIGSTSPTSIFIDAETGNFNDEWIFEGCGEDEMLQVNSTAHPNISIETDCE